MDEHQKAMNARIEADARAGLTSQQRIAKLRAEAAELPLPMATQEAMALFEAQAKAKRVAMERELTEDDRLAKLERAVELAEINQLAPADELAVLAGELSAISKSGRAPYDPQVKARRAQVLARMELLSPQVIVEEE